MLKRFLFLTIVLMLLASCGHMDVREPEMDPEGDRPPESALLSAPYIEPVCDCVYIPPAGGRPGEVEETSFMQRLTGPLP